MFLLTFAGYRQRMEHFMIAASRAIHTLWIFAGFRCQPWARSRPSTWPVRRVPAERLPTRQPSRSTVPDQRMWKKPPIIGLKTMAHRTKYRYAIKREDVRCKIAITLTEFARCHKSRLYLRAWVFHLII